MPVAQPTCLPFALGGGGGESSGLPVPAQGLSAIVWNKGSGYKVTVRTSHCLSEARCRGLARTGKRVGLSNRTVWLKRRAAGPQLSWSKGRYLIRLRTNLPLWWAERIAEHTKLVL